MLRRSFACLGVAALAVAALLLAAEPASAQRWGRGMYNAGYGYGNPYYGGYGSWNSGYGWGSYPMYSGGRYWGNYPMYSGAWGNTPWRSPTYYGEGMTEDYYGMPSGTGSGSYGASDGAGTNQALINLRVPPNAEVWFDDQKTTQTGSLRSFVSPPLNPGQDFVYNIRARWMQNGRPVERTRKLNVHAGDRLFANFMSQAPSGMPSGQYGTPGQPDTDATPSGRYGAPGQPSTTPAEDTPPRTPQPTNRPQGTPMPPSEKL